MDQQLRLEALGDQLRDTFKQDDSNIFDDLLASLDESIIDSAILVTRRVGD